MSVDFVKSAKADIEQALEDTFEASGSGYAKKLRQARKHLPKSVVKDAEYLLTAEKQLKHPKFRKFVDQKRVAAARDGVLRQTKGVDLAADRLRTRQNWWASLALQLLVAMILIGAFAYWAGAFNAPA